MRYSESTNRTSYTIAWLEKRGVTIRDIAELVLFLQGEYFDKLTVEICEHHVRKVLSKREVQNAVFTGIQLDMLAEEKKAIEPLQQMIESDEGLYGCDEVLAFSIVNVYGSIGMTNFGYVDKVKPGILSKLNDLSTGEIHTFLDDIVGAIAASASSRLAHSSDPEEDMGE